MSFLIGFFLSWAYKPQTHCLGQAASTQGSNSFTKRRTMLSRVLLAGFANLDELWSSRLIYRSYGSQYATRWKFLRTSSFKQNKLLMFKLYIMIKYLGHFHKADCSTIDNRFSFINTPVWPKCRSAYQSNTSIRYFIDISKRRMLPKKSHQSRAVPFH